MRPFIDFTGVLDNLITSLFHSVMSFIGYEYKKHKELAAYPQDLNDYNTLELDANSLI